MQYTGRPQWVNRRTMAALAVVPLATVTLLAVPATHDLVRHYRPEAAADPTRAIAQVGPLFWPFLVYANLVLWGATGLFVWTLTRVSRRYWRQSLLLIVAVLLPSVANLAHNLNLGPFRLVEPTPFLFVLTGAVLVWGLFRFRLFDLAPAARTSVFETMLDAALVLDPYRRVVKLNPAAERALGVPAPRAVGRQVEQLLEVESSLVERADDPVLPEEVELAGRRYELSATPLADRSGRVTGKVVVLRDVTERHLAHERLVRLDEQRRWLLGRVVWAQEEERRRIAGEVHDDAIQTIAAARLMLTTFRDQLTDDRQRRLLDHLEEEAQGGPTGDRGRRRRRLRGRPGQGHTPPRPPRPDQHVRAGDHGRRLVPGRQPPRRRHHRPVLAPDQGDRLGGVSAGPGPGPGSGCRSRRRS
jgi:PAS domain S-box-containing protein